MSKETFSEFATWFYRSVIGMALTVIFFFCKSNYEDFREMKMDMVMIKQEYRQNLENDKQFSNRLSKIEAQIR